MIIILVIVFSFLVIIIGMTNISKNEQDEDGLLIKKHSFTDNKSNYIYADCNTKLGNLILGTYQDSLLYFDNDKINVLKEGKLSSASLPITNIWVNEFHEYNGFLYLLYRQNDNETYHIIKLDSSFNAIAELNISDWLPVTESTYYLDMTIVNDYIAVKVNRNTLIFNFSIDLNNLNVVDQFVGNNVEGLKGAYFKASDGNEFRIFEDDAFNYAVYAHGSDEVLYKSYKYYNGYIKDILTVDQGYIYIKGFEITLHNTDSDEKTNYFNSYEIFIYSALYNDTIYTTHSKYDHTLTVNRINYDLEPLGAALIALPSKSNSTYNNNKSRIFNIDDYFVIVAEYDDNQLVFIKLDEELNIAPF